jgi:hypothetical protein
LTRNLVSGVQTHIRLVEKYGRTVLLGLRPRINPYLLDWVDLEGQYSRIPVR